MNIGKTGAASQQAATSKERNQHDNNKLNHTRQGFSGGDIEKLLKWLFLDGDVFEVCLIKPAVPKHPLWNNEFSGGKAPVIAGWFNNINLAVEAIKQADQEVKPAGIYTTLNPAKKALLARANNRLAAGVGRTKDNEIAVVRHLLIDADPERPSGISSTAAEKEKAFSLLQKIQTDLKNRGFPDPLVGDSGNGDHLIYKVFAACPVSDFLKALSAKYSTAAVHIDTKVGNPARLTKIYGTMTRKGDSTEDRPHRRAKIIHVPEYDSRRVTAQMAQDFTDTVKVPEKTCKTPTTYAGHNPQRLDVPDYLARYGVEMTGIKQHGERVLYLLKHCVFNPDHVNEASIGQATDGKLFYQCFHDSCAGKTWMDARAVISGNDKLCEPAHQVRHPAKVAESADESEWPDPEPIPGTAPKTATRIYPYECLPKTVKEAAAEVARFAKVPEVSPGVIGVATVATALGKNAKIVERKGLTHFPSIFFALLAPSGERKTPPFKYMTRPLEDWVDDQLDRYGELKAEAIAGNKVLDAAMAQIKANAKKSGVDLAKLKKKMTALEQQRQPIPVYPSIFTTNTTEERLFQKMYDRGGTFAVMSGEGRKVFDIIMGQYTGGGQTGDSIYLAGLSGDTVTRDRVGGDAGPEESLIRNPCLTACVMVQPDKYMEAASVKALRDSGALARIWPVNIPSLVGTRIEEPGELGLNEMALAPYNAMIRQLLDVERDEPLIIYLSEKASEARRVCHNEFESLMAEGKMFSDVPDIVSKAVSQITKIAMILHIADNPNLMTQDNTMIDQECWNRAEKIGRYHLTESINVQRSAGDSDVHRVAEWLKGKQEINARMVMRLGPRPRIDRSRKAIEVLETLTDLHYLRPVGDNKRSRVYIVNPKCRHCRQGMSSK